MPLAYVKHLADAGSGPGKLLYKLKTDINRPIAAILIMNTLANTAGAAFCGALVGQMYGESGVLIYSIGITLVILYLGEITPKVLGVAFNKFLAPLTSVPLTLLVKILYPMLKLSDFISTLLTRNKRKSGVSQEEVFYMAAMGIEQGTLDHFEGSVIMNVIGLDRLLVRDVLTPRVVVFRLCEDAKLGEIKDEIMNWKYSRVPLYATNDQEHLTRYVIQRDIFKDLVRGNVDVTLKELSRPLPVVPELMRVDKLLRQMFERKDHICSVVDEHGALAGIICLEDIIEEVVGKEIVDETDMVSDLRSYAKQKGSRAEKKRNQQAP